MRVFQNVPVMPFQELLAAGAGGSPHRGGPAWPDWESAGEARHHRLGRPVDHPPRWEGEAFAPFEAPAAWGGPIVGHFGHQVAEFSSRILVTRHAAPERTLLFAGRAEAPWVSMQTVPAFVRAILAWFDVPPKRARLVTAPLEVASLAVCGQEEQFGTLPPSARYLDLLDDLVRRKLGAGDPRVPTYVSRRSMPARFAGEAYLEAWLAASGFRIVHPDRLGLIDQLRAYRAADPLIFAEGSALHGLQLLGRLPARAVVVNRRPGTRLARFQVEPRVASLVYVDAVDALFYPLAANGLSLRHQGMGQLNAERLTAQLAAAGVAPSEPWHPADFAAAEAEDLAAWRAQQAGREIAEDRFA